MSDPHRTLQADHPAEATQRFRAMLEEIEDVVAIVGPDFRLRYLNESALGQADGTREELANIDIFSRLRPESIESVRSALLRAMGGESLHREFQWRRTDGQWRWYGVHMGPIDEQCEGCVLVAAHDITRHKRIESQLIQRQRLEVLGQLAGGIAHDFNNLLGGILGYASLLKMRLKDSDPKTVEHVGHIVEATHRCADVSQQLLSFSRGGKWNPKTIALNDCVCTVLTLFEPARPEGVTIRTEPADDPWPVYADTTQLQQALANLLQNAVEAIEGKGTIVVRTRNRPCRKGAEAGGGEGRRHAVLEIEDSGHGVAPMHRDRVFDSFFSTRNGHSGLGLTAVMSIVRNHGGWVELESVPGEGATVRIALPVAEDRVEATGGPVAEGVAARVMFVEKDTKLRATLADLLERAGYEPVLCESADEAVERLQCEPEGIRACLLNVTPGRATHDEAPRRLRALKPDLAMIACTLRLDPTVSDCLKSWADDILVLPADDHRVAECLRSVVGQEG
jgi:PAS domain S-box-containing protein